MPDFVLTLGDFAFQSKEIPEEIAVGGVQQLVAHPLIGGIKVVDALGRLDDDLEWSGWFLGASAKARRDYLEAYLTAGTALILTWADYRYQVLVKRFSAKFQRAYQYRYTITLEIIADLTKLSTGGNDLSIDGAVTDDLNTANGLAATVNDSTLTPLMSTLSTAIGTVSTFSGASPSTLNSVLQPLAAATQRVAVLQATGDTSIEGISGFAGLIPGGEGAAMALSLTDQVSGMEQLTALSQLSGVLGRMTQNLSNAGASDNTMTVVNGNLFSIAASEYGDPTEWTTIAQANGLADPFVSGSQDLVIPAVPSDAGGILNS